MFKTILISIFAIALSLTQSVASDGQEIAAEVKSEKIPVTEVAENSAANGDVSVMDQPVDFSTPEAVEESIERVRQEAGEDEARHLQNALGYILAYDLSLGRDKEKMYKKLNGRTPNAIIAKMKR